MQARRRGARRSAWLGLLIGTAATVASLAGWSELLSKPVAAYRRNGSLSQTFIDLLTGNGIYDGWGEGILFLLLTVVLILILLFGIARFAARLNAYIDRSRVDLSILRSRVHIRIEDIAMTRARITRRQLFHANAPDVQAYHYSHKPDRGWIDIESFHIQTTIAGVIVTGEPEIQPIAGGKGLDITERFTRPLPTSILATYLSDHWVLANRGLKMFRKVLAQRLVSFVSVDEYNQDNPSYELVFQRYPASEVTISISFPAETAPDGKDIKILRIHDNVAITIIPGYVPEDGNRILISFTLYDAENERVRIRWSNRKLKAYLDVQNPGASPDARRRRKKRNRRG